MTFYVYLTRGVGHERRVIVEANTALGAEAIAQRFLTESGERVKFAQLAGAGELRSKYGI